ncbi:MAG: S24/S26 family peptidase [Cyanobacteria bacterium J06627_3]
MDNGQWTGGNALPPQAKMLPKAGWAECAQWLLGRRQRFVVRENSMVPTLMPGDTILAEMGVAVQIGDVAILRWRDVTNGPEFGWFASSKAVSTPSDMLMIKRVSEIFYGEGVYLISDNAHEPSARDSRHFGVVEADKIIGRATSRLATAL